MSIVYYKLIVSGIPNPTDSDISACSSIRIDLDNTPDVDDFKDGLFNMSVDLTYSYKNELRKKCKGKSK